jgi:ribosome-binding factor A
MNESKRQKQISSLLNEELNDIFRRLNLNMLDGGMVSISSVKVTPDLLEARVYVSLFQVKNPDDGMKKIEDRGWEVKRELASRVKQQLRRMPELRFFRDDTLDHAFKMEELFRQIKKDDKKEE